MNSNLERYELSNPRFNAVHIFNIVFLPCVVTFGEQVECLSESSQFGVHRFCRDVQHTAVSNSWGDCTVFSFFFKGTYKVKPWAWMQNAR